MTAGFLGTIVDRLLQARSQRPFSTPVALDPTPQIDPIRLELGYGLLTLVQSDSSGTDAISERVKTLRRQVAGELGFIFPPLRILDNMQLEPNSYQIKLKETSVASGAVHADRLMTMNPTGGPIDLPGIKTIEPTFGLPATWIEEHLRDDAEFLGYSVIDPSTVVSTHLMEIVRESAADLFSYQDAVEILRSLPLHYIRLLRQLEYLDFHFWRVCRELLRERVTISDYETILSATAGAILDGLDSKETTEAVREQMSHIICGSAIGPDGTLPILLLGERWEQLFDRNRHKPALGAINEPEFISSIARAFEMAAKIGEIPVLLASDNNRPAVKRTIDLSGRSQTIVISPSQLDTRTRVKLISTVE